MSCSRPVTTTKLHGCQFRDDGARRPGFADPLQVLAGNRLAVVLTHVTGCPDRIPGLHVQVLSHSPAPGPQPPGARYSQAAYVSPLPSESPLQQEHGVSRGTIRHALGILQEESFIAWITGRGTFVKSK